jgi:hypothetical protein
MKLAFVERATNSVAASCHGPFCRTREVRNHIRRWNMKKLVIAALASAALLVAGSSAFAGWYDGWGYYHPSCYFTYYGYVCY